MPTDGALPFPDIHIEGAWKPPDLESAFYDTPGVYLINRRDLRTDCNREGISHWVLPKNRTSAEHAQDIFDGQTYLRRTFESRWAAQGKPFKHVALLIGPNAGDTHLARLAHHPDDRPTHFMFFRNGREECARYYAAALTLYRNLLDDAPGATLPQAILDDSEIVGDLAGAFAPGGDPAKGNWALARADPRFADPAEFTQDRSLRDWCGTDHRLHLLHGGDIPVLDPHVNPYDPRAWDAQATSMEAGFRACQQATHRALGVPVNLVFGGSILHGSWNHHSRSRDYPFELRPKQELYNLDGDFPLSLQVPVNYSDPPAFRAFNDPGAASTKDDRWETPANSITRAADLGARIEGSSYEQYLRAATFFRKRQVLAAHNSNPSKPIWVSIACHDDLHGPYPADWPNPKADPQFQVRARCMTDYLMFCVRQCGLAGAWYFAPGYDDNPQIRARVRKFISIARAAFASGDSPADVGS